ncbi:MAG: hypothetical protein K8I29_09435 [Alphaproteobacteria bacterium]|uniref:Uncharacterized protein n=1 Tax=Candidatus Nitrobium versatile TaxID=2884831 RepID=A0A953J670_9BACT|nr:hypothetical protein [Candidatus Nitrobium versatile]
MKKADTILRGILRGAVFAVALLVLPASALAASGKSGWKRNYMPKDSSGQELLKACGYGNIKACFAYHKNYILKDAALHPREKAER